MLPLLVLLLNSTYIWLSTALTWLLVPQNASITYKEFSQIQVLSFAIYLEPLNTFLYTWRFMNSIENEKHGQSKNFFKAFRLTMVAVVPTVTIALYLAFSLMMRQYYVLAGE